LLVPQAPDIVITARNAGRTFTIFVNSSFTCSRQPGRPTTQLDRSHKDPGSHTISSDLTALTGPLDKDDMVQVCVIAARSFAHSGQFDPGMAPLACVRAFPGDQRKATSAWIRLECLANVVTDPRMRPWQLEGGESGALRLSDHVFHAAAIEPVLSKDPEGRSPYFDADAFFARVLGLAVQSGEA
jgi:hypothetical protein